MQPRTSRAVGAGFRVAAQTRQGANLPGGTSLGFFVKGRAGLVASVAFGPVIKDLHGDAHDISGSWVRGKGGRGEE